MTSTRMVIRYGDMDKSSTGIATPAAFLSINPGFGYTDTAENAAHLPFVTGTGHGRTGSKGEEAAND